MENKKLEFARKMTKQEVDNFYSFIRKKQDDKVALAREVLEQYAGKLINEYHAFAYKAEEEMDKHKDFISMAQSCYENQTCQCGLKLKLFTNRYNGQQFLGCPDYMDDTKVHKAWNYAPGEDYRYIFKNWLTTIITNLGLRDKLHTKYLLLFYEENGLCDLQYKHIGISSKVLIDRYTNTNKSSKEFELRQVEFLRNQWPNVIYQFPVKYKYFGEKEKFCFIDILCSNDETICIYECKTSKFDINNDQMNLYVNVVKFINDSLKINKTLTIDYITEN